MSKDFLINIINRNGDMIYGALKGAVCACMLEEFIGVDEESATEKVEFINSVNLFLSQNADTGEWALSLQAEIEGEIHNSIWYDSQIRIGEDLQISRSGDPESYFEFLSLSVLTALSTFLISSRFTHFDISELKKYVCSVFNKYPCSDFDGGFVIIIPQIKGMENPFSVAFVYEHGDIVVYMSNGCVAKDDDGEILETQESLRLTIDGHLYKTSLSDDSSDEVFVKFYDGMCKTVAEVLKGFVKSIAKT